jgi:hypothetical protein
VHAAPAAGKKKGKKKGASSAPRAEEAKSAAKSTTSASGASSAPAAAAAPAASAASQGKKLVIEKAGQLSDFGIVRPLKAPVEAELRAALAAAKGSPREVDAREALGVGLWELGALLRLLRRGRCCFCAHACVMRGGAQATTRKRAPCCRPASSSAAPRAARPSSPSC